MPDLHDRVRRALLDDTAREARRHGTQPIRERVPRALPAYPELQSRVRRSKERALDSLEELLDQAEARLMSHGFHVYRAVDAAAARDYILSHMPQSSLVIKSKSNLAKEIHLPDALREAGHRVIETDLGDHINQLMGRQSGHVLMPAIGVTIEEIQKTFQEQFHEPDLKPRPEDLVASARRHLRPLLEEAGVGISGANAVTATGEIVLMENEGNIRAVTSLPDVHFVVAAVTKVVESLEDALSVVQAASLYGIGQDFGNYCTVLSGPGRDIGPDVHVVLVDDGRVKAILDEPEPFYCINCGSCLNVCPVYAELGEAYGGERLGGIGVMQTFLLNGEERALHDGLDLCLGCQRCVPACPVKIDTPAITNRLKARRRTIPTGPLRQRFLRLVHSPVDLKRSRWALSAAATLGIAARWHRRGRKAEDFIPVPTSHQPLPAGRVYPGAEPIRGSVWIFPGCVMDAWYSGVHQDTIRVLNANGYTVRVPQQKFCCGALDAHAGATPLGSPSWDTFSGNDPIILNSAGCGAYLTQHPNPLSDRVEDLTAFLTRVGFRAPPKPVSGTPLAYHNPCHLAYAQQIAEEPRQLLAMAGYHLVDVPAGEACCGSAGTYNLEFPELAWNLARRKAADLGASGAALACTANPGCLMQIRAGLESLGSNIRLEHIATLLAHAYAGDVS